MPLAEVISLLLLLAGCGFYLAGTVGLLRFPDVHCRLHALTKADNLGLMLVCAAMAIQSGSLRTSLLLLITWGFALMAATVSAYLIARHARERAPVDERETRR